MGLTLHSTGKNSYDTDFSIKKSTDDDIVIALAGNPNVGKSTIFNYLTGMKQHTGNWPGKTVSNAQGTLTFNNKNYIFVDIPGTYSLFTHSKEEEIAGDFICFGNPDSIIVVCDATCLERNLNLALQALEITSNVLICVNLMDEAEKKEIKIDLELISKRLNVPVVGVCAKTGEGIEEMLTTLEETRNNKGVKIQYTPIVETAIEEISNTLAKKDFKTKLNFRWISLKLLENNAELSDKISNSIGFDLSGDEEISSTVQEVQELLTKNNINTEKLKDITAKCTILFAEEICNEAVTFNNKSYNLRDRKADKILTSKKYGIPVMLLMLGFVFWLTIFAANVPSEMLSAFLFGLEDNFVSFFIYLKAPSIVYKILVFGVYRVVSWVVSVMLPPMAIFFPLFTLLEDLGYLPRIAFNLDKAFKKCHTCGKQALTMCMGFGCNAAGITGCRIIDSPRERLIAILTNSFVPCNGRFPMLISLITVFFTIYTPKPFNSIFGAIILTAIVLLGILVTFIMSEILSKTVLKGKTSSFTLELPPYRTPQIGKTIVRSIFDRTLFVLGRAVSVAAPAGLIIWIFANTYINDTSILNHCADFLDPFARLMGLDGKILMAFIMGLPANEIVIPVLILAYTSGENLQRIENLFELREILTLNGWTYITAINVMLFSLFHWPCSTSLITIKKETGSFKWAFLGFLLPTITGILICMLINGIYTIIK